MMCIAKKTDKGIRGGRGLEVLRPRNYGFNFDILLHVNYFQEHGGFEFYGAIHFYLIKQRSCFRAKTPVIVKKIQGQRNNTGGLVKAKVRGKGIEECNRMHFLFACTCESIQMFIIYLRAS